jgi:hypothetical protein
MLPECSAGGSIVWDAACEQPASLVPGCVSAVEKRYPHTSSKDGRPRHANELTEVKARQHWVLTTRLTPQPHHPRLPAGLQLAMHWWVGSHELRRYDGRM